MATKTRRDLIDQVLDNLGVLVIGQAPSDDMVSRVDGLLDAALANLAGREVVYVADAGTAAPPADGEIDETVFLPLADIVAFICAPKFNLAGDASLAALSTRAEENLRVIGRPARTRKTLTTDAQLRGGWRWGRHAINFTTGQ